MGQWRVALLSACWAAAALQQGASVREALPRTDSCDTGIGRRSLPGPAPGSDASAWRAANHAWRAKCLAELRPTGKIFDTVGAWSSGVYVQPITMPFDRYLYNDTSGEWQLDAFLASLPGGADAVLLCAPPIPGPLPCRVGEWGAAVGCRGDVPEPRRG